MKKRLISMILVLTILISAFPVTVFAVNSQDNERDTANNDELSMEGTNSFGSLVSQDVEEEREAIAEAAENYPAGYSVTDLVIEGNIATVTYYTLEEATLVVSLYTEDGLQLLASGKTDVTPDDNTAIVSIEGNMPEYFQAEAFLLDTYDYSPLCASYHTPMYTQEMQELLASTVEDYDADRVLNLDNDPTTNFAIYADSTILIDEQEGVNTVASVDNETATYVIENADESITSLKAGDIFAYPYVENEVLIVKIASISIDDTTVTIIGDEMDMNEAFDAVKIETDVSSGDFTVDESTAAEGVSYFGLEVVTEEAMLLSGSNTRAARASKAAREVELSLGFKFDEVKLSKSVKLTGSYMLNLKADFDYYVTLKYQKITFEVSYGSTTSIELSGKIAEEKIPLPSLGVSPVPGLYIGFEPDFIVEAEASIEFSMFIGQTVSIGYEKGPGWGAHYGNPEVDTDLEFAGTIKIGVDLSPTVSVAGGYLVSLSAELVCGVSLKATMDGTDYDFNPSESEKHLCKRCVDIDISRFIEISPKVTFFNLEKLTLSKTVCKFTHHIWDAYYSFDYGTFSLFKPCPHKLYRVTIEVEKQNGMDADNARVIIDGDEENALYTEKGNTVTAYLATGDHTIKAILSDNSQGVTKIHVGNSERKVKVVVKSNSDGSGIKQPSIFDSIDSEIIIDGKREIVASGNCGADGDNVTWTLYDNGLLEIKGSGIMANYSFPDYSPWNGYSDDINQVIIENGITHIGDSAFYDCSSLTNIVIPDSVTSIGEWAFNGCSSLTYIVIPDGITSIELGTFFTCSSLKSVELPESITSIGDNAFAGCYSLESIEIPDGVTIIRGRAFGYCTSLVSVRIPYGVTSIWEYAFMGCSNLTSIVIPDSVTRIYEYAFDGCEKLNTVHYSGSKDQWDDISIAYYNLNLTSANIFYYSTGALLIDDINVVNENSEKVTIVKSGENADFKNIEALRSIHSGKYDDIIINNYILKTASFTDLVPNEQYVMLALASVDVEDPLTADNLLYIKQGVADEDGNLTFEYVQRVATEISYVVACGASNKNLKDATVTFLKMTANGEIQAVDPIVVYDGKTLVEEQDYIITGTVQFTEAGEYTCIIRGVNNYTGIAEYTYTCSASAVLRGDANADGTVSNADLVIIARYIVELEEYLPSAVNADMDGDTMITNSDLVALARLIVGI